MKRIIPNFTQASNPDMPARALYHAMASTVDVSRPVKVYRNLHKDCYSVQQAGLVVCHTDRLVLKNVTFTVRERGRDKVRETRKKNVHAFINGEVMDPLDCIVVGEGWDSVTYNPYAHDTFVTSNTEEEVNHANYCDMMIGEGSPVLAYNVNCEL